MAQTSSFTAGSADLGLGGGVGTNGALITYTFTLTNGGPDARIERRLHRHAAVVAALPVDHPAPGFNCTTPPVGTTGTITCTAASFANGGTGTFTLVTTAAPGTTGNINNSAGVSSATSDPNSGNSSFSRTGRDGAGDDEHSRALDLGADAPRPQSSARERWTMLSGLDVIRNVRI